MHLLSHNQDPSKRPVTSKREGLLFATDHTFFKHSNSSKVCELFRKVCKIMNFNKFENFGKCEVGILQLFVITWSRA